MHGIFCLILSPGRVKVEVDLQRCQQQQRLSGPRRRGVCTRQLRRLSWGAHSGTFGALAASAVRGTAIVSVGGGSFAGAATDLLDAMLVEGMGEPAAAATDLLEKEN